MPISLSSSRNDFAERVLSRISVSLCCTSGWPTTVTPSCMSVLVERAADRAHGGVGFRRLGRVVAGGFLGGDLDPAIGGPPMSDVGAASPVHSNTRTHTNPILPPRQ